jgi:hypothetical protein
MRALRLRSFAGEAVPLRLALAAQSTSPASGRGRKRLFSLAASGRGAACLVGERCCQISFGTDADGVKAQPLGHAVQFFKQGVS